MNYSKIVKIIPMLDSPNDSEALSALRALGRALAPESFGDVARLIEAALAAEEPAKPEPFRGFRSAAKGPKPAKPLGDGWVWGERAWAWMAVPRPQVSRFQSVRWEEPNWKISIDFPKVMVTAMEVMNTKLNRRNKEIIEGVFVAAMSETHISTSHLNFLENLERTKANV